MEKDPDTTPRGAIESIDADLRKRGFLIRPGAMALVRLVLIDAADHGTNDGAAIHDADDAGENTADHDDVYAGGDGPEPATGFLRRVGLDLPRVLMRRSAAQEDVDDRLVAGFTEGRFGQREDAGAQAQGPGLEKSAFDNAVARLIVATFEDCQHGVIAPERYGYRINVP